MIKMRHIDNHLLHIAGTQKRRISGQQHTLTHPKITDTGDDDNLDHDSSSQQHFGI